MTTLASSSLQVPTSAPAPTPPLPPTDSLSNSWLLSWTLARSGFSTTLAIAGDSPVTHTAPIARTTQHFAIHLTRPLPISTLLAALTRLRPRQSPAALLLLADPPKKNAYREHLHLNADSHVLGIRRHFPQSARQNPKPQFVGLIWKVPQRSSNFSLQSPLHQPWQSLRALKRTLTSIVPHNLPNLPTLRDPKSHLLSQHPPHSLRALAADLHFTQLRDYIFAHPDAEISPHALLRGPLFIDAGSQILPDHTHIGPGWITKKSPAVTVGAGNAHPSITPDLTFLGTSNLKLPPQISHPEYFIGPRTHHKPLYNFTKRLFDIAFSFAAIAVTLPICLAVALIIKAYDRGPIFFIHKREGRNAKPFGCIKFRTMVRNAEAIKQKLRATNQVDGPQFKMANDPRITPIGRFLRKTNIDELPQFLNVLRGDMSIVGPRPSPFEENQLCPGWREARLSVTPGITGLWQISRSRERGAADFQEWIFFDTQYVDRRSFFLDLRILLLTLKELFGKGQ